MHPLQIDALSKLQRRWYSWLALLWVLTLGMALLITTSVSAAPLADLTASTVNDTNGTVVLGNSFIWTMQVTNIASPSTADFTSGQVVFEDHLPTEASYSSVSVTPTGGIGGSVDCSLGPNVLSCTAGAGGFSIPGGEAFAVAITAIPTAAGSLVNPTGGVCMADPNAVLSEVSTVNNSCSDTVTVTRPNTTVVSLTRQSANPNRNATVTWQIVFADPVDGLTASNFSLVQTGVTGASILGVTETSGPPSTTWNITADTGSGDGSLELDLNNDTGLSHTVTNTTFTGETYDIDKTGPLVTSIVRQSPTSTPTNADALVFRVTFNEKVTNVGASSFVVNGTNTPISSSVSAINPNLVFDFAIDGIADGGNLANLNGIVGLDINASPAITDLAGNPLQVVEPATANDETYSVDNTAPKVTSIVRQSPGTNPTNADALVFRVTFNEKVTSVGASSFVVNGTTTTINTVQSITPNLVFDFTLDGTVDGNLASVNGTVGLDIAASPIIRDLAGNTLQVVEPTPSATNDQTFSLDNTAPTVVIVVAKTALKIGDTSSVKFTFSERVTGFTSADYTSPNATHTGLSSSDGGLTWTATLTPFANIQDATNIVTLDNTGLQDLFGNSGTGSTTSNNYAVDTLRPTATITVAKSVLKIGDTSSVSFTFAEPVTAFTIADLTAANGTLSGLSTSDGGVTWTVTLTPLANIQNATNIITLDNTGVNDLAGNAGSGSTNSNNYAVDTVAPTVMIDQAGSQSDPTTSSPINFTITFNEAVTGFATGDVNLSSGTASGTLTGIVTEIAPNDGTTYNLAVSGMTGGGTIIATVPASVAQDLAGNNNITSISTDHTVIYAPSTDLSITKTDGVTTATPEGSVTYTITASNAGPSDASGATVADTFPASLTATWTCVGAGGGTCTASGSGNINDTVNLPAGGSVTYTASASVSAAASGSLSNTATVTAPPGVTDPTPGNNSATDSDTVVSQVAVTINQATGQADPTNASTINFTVVFASAVTGFGDVASDVILGGTAGATTVSITGGPSTYNVTVSGMTSDGTVTATIPAGVATGSQSESNAASTTSDNIVIYIYKVPPVIAEGASVNVMMSKNGNPMPFALTLHATDANSDPLTWSIQTGGSHGTANAAAGPSSSSTISYQPNLSYSGSDSFVVQVSDGNGGIDTIMVNVTIQPVRYTIALPLVLSDTKPDLVASISISPNKSTFTAGEPVVIQVTITNRGSATANPFWVDLYLNPSSPPTAANQTWNTRCGMTPCFGIAWQVTNRLAPGQSITLFSQSLTGDYSTWKGWFATGTTDLYVYADSYNPDVATGAVAESDETNNRAEIHGLSVSGTNPSLATLDMQQTLSERPIPR